MPVALFLLMLLLPVIRSDLKERRIPNNVLLGSLITSLAVALIGWGSSDQGAAAGAAHWAGGLLTGLLCFLPLHLLRAMGAGDVKLMATCGACLGPVLAWQAALGALMVGGVMAVMWQVWFGLPFIVLWRPFGAIWSRVTSLVFATGSPGQIESRTGGPLRHTSARLPFSLPILLASIGVVFF